MDLQHNQDQSMSCSRLLAQSLSVDPEQLQTSGSHRLPPRLAEDMTPVPKIHLGYMVTLAPKYGPSCLANWAKIYTDMQRKTVRN